MGHWLTFHLMYPGGSFLYTQFDTFVTITLTMFQKEHSISSVMMISKSPKVMIHNYRGRVTVTGSLGKTIYTIRTDPFPCVISYRESKWCIGDSSSPLTSFLPDNFRVYTWNDPFGRTGPSTYTIGVGNENFKSVSSPVDGVYWTTLLTKGAGGRIVTRDAH